MSAPINMLPQLINNVTWNHGRFIYFKHIPVSSYFKNKDNNVELSTPYLLKVENCFEISKHIKSATEVLKNVLEPGSVNLCLSSSIGIC